MKNIIALAVSMAILLSAPLAMARGNTVRAKLNRIWNKEQVRQERIDQSLDNISKNIDKALLQSQGSYGKGASSSRTGSGK